MKNSIKIGIISGIIAVCITVTLAYAAISGSYAVAVVDPANALKYYTVPGTVAGGMYVQVRSSASVSVLQGTSPWVVSQSAQANLLATVYQPTQTNLLMTAYQPTATNLNMTAAQPTASLLNATVTPASAATFTIRQTTASALQVTVTPASASTFTVQPKIMSTDTVPFTIVEWSHALIHTGNMFSISDYQSIETGVTYDYLITTTTSTTVVHFGWDVSISTDPLLPQMFRAYLYETPTYGSSGSVITIYNVNRNSNTAAKTVIYSAPSITTTGTQIYTDLIGSSGSIKNIRNTAGVILKFNTPYIFRLTNVGAGTGISVVNFMWSEQTQ